MNKKIFIALCVLGANFVFSYRSFGQDAPIVYVMFGNPNAISPADTNYTNDGGCLETGICSNNAAGAANIPPAAATATYTASNIAPIPPLPSPGDRAVKNRYAGTITMTIKKRRFHNQKTHRKQFRNHNYTFRGSVQIPATFIGNISPDLKIDHIEIPPTNYTVKNPFLRPFKMTITNVIFVTK